MVILRRFSSVCATWLKDLTRHPRFDLLQRWTSGQFDKRLYNACVSIVATWLKTGGRATYLLSARPALTIGPPWVEFGRLREGGEAPDMGLLLRNSRTEVQGEVWVRLVKSCGFKHNHLERANAPTSITRPSVPH